MNNMIKRYFQIAKEDSHYLLLGLISGSISSYYIVHVNENMSKILEGDFSNERLKLLYYTSIITIITTSIRGTCFTYAQSCLNYRLSNIIYEKVLYQDPVFYQKTPVNTILERATNDVKTVSNIISLNINVITRSLVSILITLWLLSRISYSLTFIILILTPVQYYTAKLYDKIHTHIMKGHEEASKILNTHVHESISHISIMKTFGAEELMNRKHQTLRKACADYNTNESIIYGLNLFIVYNFPTLTTIATIVSAKYLHITTGLTTFILHNQGLYGTIKHVIDLNNEFVKCKEPLKRIIELLDSKMPTEGYYIPIENILIPSIDFQNIDFKYESAETPILRNLTFSIKPYDRIAIIGPSGCGKSTIAKLLTGILSPSAGTIYVDNVNINKFNSKWLRHQIGYVAQDNIIFADTIANNISYGLDTCSEEQIIEASKIANAHEFIMKLPNQYNTKLEGTELSSLSGGQKQRIAIARALVRKPKIIIFDEATSALDPYCEELVQNTIKDCFQNHNLDATMIIIAHRRSALDIADKIYKLEDSVLHLQ